MTVGTEITREYLTKRIATKQEELAKVEYQLEEVINHDDELKLERKAQRLLKDIEDIDNQLKELDCRNSSSNIRYLNLEKSFQKIDFNQAKKIADSINNKLDDASGAILLFLQRSTKQKGCYCLDEVLDLMVRDRKVGDDIIGDFRSYPIDLGSPISEFNEVEFSKRLASHLSSDSGACLPKSIERLCLSLRGGSTIFIRVENWDSVIDQENFLNWFIKEFWHPLISDLNPIFGEFGKIRFIVALVAKSKVFDDCSYLSPCFCTADTFQSGKAIELPLPDWEVEDIKKWLINFRGLSNAESLKLAKQIHRESEGTPDTICSILERDFRI